MDDREARDRVARIDALLEQVERLAEPAARDAATELVAAMLDLYGEGLARILAELARHDAGDAAAALADDELVSHLLLLHGLHPVPLEARVTGALDEVRPYLASHGGGVELLGVEEEVVRLRLEGSCNGCPSSAVTLKLAVEDAIHKAAPEVERIEAVGGAEPAPALLQIGESESLRTDGFWADAGVLAELPASAPVLADVAGERVLLVRLGRTAYAYRPDCPGCDEPLAGGRLNGARLACPGCGLRFDVHRAGRCLDSAELHLEPVPLLAGADGRIRLALGAAA